MNNYGPALCKLLLLIWYNPVSKTDVGGQNWVLIPGSREIQRTVYGLAEVYYPSKQV